MTISVCNTFNHHSPRKKKLIENNEDLKATVAKSIENIGFNSENVRWNSDGHLEISQSNILKLHTLILELERLGLNLKMTKQTLIEVC